MWGGSGGMWGGSGGMVGSQVPRGRARRIGVGRWTLRGRRPSAWSALVPVVALAAGLLFATSGRTAQGTDLRAGEVTELSGLIAQRNRAIADQEEQLAELQRQVQQLTDQAASRNSGVAAAQAAGDA